MKDYYLSAPTEAELAAALPAWMKSKDPETLGNVLAASPFHSMDWGIQIVVKPAVIEDGEVVEQAVIHPAFHANLRLFDEGLEASVEQSLANHIDTPPATPQRVWA